MNGSLISNSFEYHSNGFELGLGLVLSKMLRILVELRKVMKEFMDKVWRPNLKQKRNEIILQVCLWVIPK